MHPSRPGVRLRPRTNSSAHQAERPTGWRHTRLDRAALPGRLRGGGICRSFGVRRLDAFGSAVREDVDPARSDVDHLVDFAHDEERNRFLDYFAFRHALARLLDRPVDLVMADALTNRYLEAAIDAERQLVYAA